MDTTTGSTRRRHPPTPSRGASRRTWRPIAAIIATMTLVAAGCASFPDSSPTVTVQPSLSPVMPSVIPPSQPGSPSSSSGPSSPDPSSPSSTTTATDPCAPTDSAVVATCLDAPWGLAPLPDGSSALVGERTTGKVFRVGVQQPKTLVTTIGDVDAAGDGGLLGIALSPYYSEDGLVYAYLTTATDNRIVRFAPGQQPKVILAGIPKGDTHNGGPIAFGADNYLYIATGDAGDPQAAASPSSLAGKVLRVDTFGKPAPGNPGSDSRGGPSTSGSPKTSGGPSTSGSPSTSANPSTPSSPTASTAPGQSAAAVYASGLTDPTGICPLSDGSIGVVDHRPAADLLLPVKSGKDYTTVASADALWTYTPGDGGGIDCAVSGGYLLATSLSAAKITGVPLAPSGGFTGSPEDLVKNRYGRLLSLVTGPHDLVWATTSNKDGHGTPVSSDDRVIVLPSAAGGGGGGGGGPD